MGISLHTSYNHTIQYIIVKPTTVTVTDKINDQTSMQCLHTKKGYGIHTQYKILSLNSVLLKIFILKMCVHVC